MHETVIVGEQVAGEAAQTIKKLEAVINESNRSAFDIGELAHTVQSKGYYAERGFTTAQEFFSTLDIKLRRVQYLRRMASVMETVGIPRSQYEPVGIAKLRHITSLDPNATWTNPDTQEATPMKEFIVGFVEKAEELDLETIKQHVRTLKGCVGENDFAFLNISIKRSALDNTVRPALEAAKAAIGSVKKDDEGMSVDASDGTALEYIAADYMSDPGNNVLPESEGQYT